MPTQRIPRMTAMLTLMLLLGVCSTLSAHPSKPHPEAEEHKPTPLPDRIVLTWTGNPATSQAVTWRTDTSVTEAQAQFAEAQVNAYFKSVTTIPARTELLNSNLGKAHYHSAIFKGLKPKTLYVYRVGDGSNWSEWVHFRTASDKPEPFTFLYYGDAQNCLKSHWSRCIRESIMDAPRASFMVHAGDLVNRANLDAHWGEWFYAGGFIPTMVPTIATPGNHEYDGIEERRLSDHWRPQFTYPEHGPSGLEETVYYIDYQGVRIVCLNTNEGREKQVAWLHSVLKNNPNKWTILTFHVPMFSASEGRDDPNMRILWKPIIDLHKVDLVLTGHDHSYARSGLMGVENAMTGSRVVTKGGTVYAVSVSGPKMYKLDDRPWMQKTAEGVQLYQVINVNGDKLNFKAYTVTGELYDAFELQKKKDGNEIVELMSKQQAER